MSKNKVQRIAFVKLSPKGRSSYAMRCDREDLVVGDQVEVVMYAGTDKEYYDDGEITSIDFKRWDCSCHVVNHICEVDYKLDEDLVLHRLVFPAGSKAVDIDEWRKRRQPYVESLSEKAKSEMIELYNAVAPIDGEDAYLSDGIWIRPDGSLVDSGR